MIKKRFPVQALQIIATITYFVMNDAVTMIVGKAGSSFGGLLLIALLALILVVTIYVNRGKLQIRFTQLHLYFLIFSVYCLLNCVWASYRSAALSRTTDLIEIFVAMCVVYLVFQDKTSADDILKIIMLGGFFLIMTYVLLYGWGNLIRLLRDTERASSDLMNANTIGMSAAYALTIFVNYWINHRLKKWWIPLAALSLVVLVVSQSRKALVILMLGPAGVFLLNNLGTRNIGKRAQRLLVAFLVLGIAAYIAFETGLMESYFGRMEGMINSFLNTGVVDKSSAMRATFRRFGIELFRQHPIGGVGIDCARYFTSHLYKLNYHLHNNYIELLADGGVVGFVLYYWLYIAMLLRMLRYRNWNDPEFNICFVLLGLRLIMDYGIYTYKTRNTYFYLILFFVCYKNLKRRAAEKRLEGEVLIRE